MKNNEYLTEEEKRINRARQFMPFDGLTGFRSYIRKAEKVKVKRHNLMDEEREELDQVLLSLKKRMIVKIIYYSDEEYLELEGVITNIDYINKTIKIVNQTILMSDIYKIEIVNEKI